MFKRKNKKTAHDSDNNIENSVESSSVIEEEIADTIEESLNDSKGNISFSDFDPKLEGDNDLSLNQTDQLTDQLIEDLIEDTNGDEPKKDLSLFFENDTKKAKKLKIKEKKPKKESRRSKKKEREFQDIKDRKLYKYNNKKYTKVEDFVKYLNDHYLDIDDIAKEVLDDEHFYGWINKNSGIFEQSLVKFKEIKEKIEK